MTRSQKTQVRIIAGRFRGRRLSCVVNPELRPTPQMVREAYFSILGDAIPERPFFDLFAGTGVIGLEALSRGATHAVFLERDARLANAIEGYLRQFGAANAGQVLRADVYRWAERWQPFDEVPANFFLSPPFPDLTTRLDDFLALVATLQGKVRIGSIITVQAELGFPSERLPDAAQWEMRAYGRNLLFIWICGAQPVPEPPLTALPDEIS